jgi:hypothetical protein
MRKTERSIRQVFRGAEGSPGLCSESRMANAARRACVLTAVLLGILHLACDSGSSGLADTGGMSGTGISQGTVSAFGSIFVNGVEWELAAATIEIDGRAGTESDLRLGMVVRVEGEFGAGGTTGTASRVAFDDSIEGPIAMAPIETIPGVEKTFMVLGQSIVVREGTTIFGDGATFVNLAADDVVEVSGFTDQVGAIQATRVELKGQLPVDNEVELRGPVSNLMTNPDGTGIFDIGSVVVRYTASSDFSNVTRATLEDGDEVEVEGRLRVTGTEIDADEVELEEAGLGSEDATRVELEGIARTCPESTDFCVGGVPVDASSAVFEPADFMPMPGDSVEVEGPLVGGVLLAERIESENDDSDEGTTRIEAQVTSVDVLARSLTILGVTVRADGDTELEDSSSVEDESFMFGEILVGDFLVIEGFDTGTSEVLAHSIQRDDAIAGNDEVVLEGPVTEVGPLPSLSILGQSIPLDAGTQYFDEAEFMRTEEEFFRNPGDVQLGDIVKAIDEEAADLSVLFEADEVEIE